MKKYFQDNKTITTSFTKLTKEQKRKIKVVRKLSRLIDYLILILSLLALIVGIYTYVDTNIILDNASSQKYQMYKPNKENNYTFDEIKNINKDVIGWIDIYGTKIDYPIVQGKDNDEYINKTVLGEFSTAGSIFLDYRNSYDFSDFQNIIYGHYMVERKMFGDISLFSDKNFFDTHKYGVLHRVDKKSKGIKVLAYLKTLGTSKTYLQPAKKEEEKKWLIETIKKEAINKREEDLESEKNILILDTCNLEETNGRYILVCTLTDEIEENPFGEEKENKYKKLLDKAKGINFFEIILLFWIISLIVYILGKKKEKRR